MRKKGHASCRSFLIWKEKHPLEGLKGERRQITKVCSHTQSCCCVGWLWGNFGWWWHRELRPTLFRICVQWRPQPIHKQLQKLNNLLAKRKNAILKPTSNSPRVEKKGFRNDYAKHGEELQRLKSTAKAKKEIEKVSSALIKQIESPKDWQIYCTNHVRRTMKKKKIADFSQAFWIRDIRI